jgi:hypothetical protein
MCRSIAATFTNPGSRRPSPCTARRARHSSRILSCPVIYRHDTRRLVCPCHNGHFDAETGAVLQGPPPRPLPRVLLEERGDELVAVGMAGEEEA